MPICTPRVRVNAYQSGAMGTIASSNIGHIAIRGTRSSAIPFLKRTTMDSGDGIVAVHVASFATLHLPHSHNVKINHSAILLGSKSSNLIAGLLEGRIGCGFNAGNPAIAISLS